MRTTANDDNGEDKNNIPFNTECYRLICNNNVLFRAVLNLLPGQTGNPLSLDVPIPLSPVSKRGNVAINQLAAGAAKSGIL